MLQSNRISRQDRVLAVVQENTQQALNAADEGNLGIHAGTIAQMLGLDRANVARELNTLYKNGQLIKLQGKPTLYICRSVLGQRYPNVFFPSTMPKGSSLESYLTTQPATQEVPEPSQVTALETQVGVYFTLRGAILRAKAAVTYPSHDLHTLITGSVGVGKAIFAQAMYQHAVAKGSLSADAPFVVINCQEHKLAPQLLMNQLFGYARGAAQGDKSRRGLIERAAGGILCLNGIDNLSPTIQNALVTLLEKNTYTRVGDPSVTRYSSAMIIAISTQDPDSEAMKPLAQRFPVQIRIPDLNEWSLRELMEILIETFQKEATSSGLSFRINREALSVFLKASYPGNLGELSSIARTTCALVFLAYNSVSPKPKIMEITLRHLPPEFLGSILEDGSKDLQVRLLMQELDLEYMSFFPNGFSTNRYSSRALLDKLHQKSDRESQSVGLQPAFLTTVEDLTAEYFAAQSIPKRMPLSAMHDHFPEELSAHIRRCLEAHPTFSRIKDDFGSLYRLASCLHDAMKGNLPKLDSQRLLLSRVKSVCAQEAACCESLCAGLGGSICESDQVYIIMCLRLLHTTANAGVLPILVVFHGQGVAEGMAEYVNEAVDASVATGISFRPGMSMDVLLEEVVDTARRVNQGQGVVLAVDMEPLTDLHDYLRKQAGIPARTVANVTLPLLLDLAQAAMEEGAELLEGILQPQPQTHPENAFLTRTMKEVLAPSLTFLNPVKATEALESALNGLTQELGLAQTRELSVKFIFHCAHMLERLIRGEDLRYEGLKVFVNRYSRLMDALEKHMQHAAEIFGVTIPAGELAYIAEILLPYLG